MRLTGAPQNTEQEIYQNCVRNVNGMLYVKIIYNLVVNLQCF